MTSFPQIVVGTYEEFVLGYNPQYLNKKNKKCKLDQTFATHSHQASVRCVAAYQHLMASSGADEYINIYNMDAMEVSTVINYHNSTVTCLEFTPDGSHLVSANQNGDVAIFRCNDWTLVKLWKEAHKHAGGVTSISVHPSGSLLLTTGTDNILRFWNLVKGRLAFATNFSKKCSLGNILNFGMWSKKGNYYSVCFGKTLEIYRTKTAAVVYQLQANSKITCATFIKENLLCFATEGGLLEVHLINKNLLLLKKQVQKNRVKSLTSFSFTVFKNNKYITKNHVVSVGSEGEIKIWYLKKKKLNYLLLLIGEANCDCRITCLTTVTSKYVKVEENLPELINPSMPATKNPNEEINDISNHLNLEEETSEKVHNRLKMVKQDSEKSFSLLNGKKLKKKFNKSVGIQNSDLNKKILKHLKKKKLTKSKVRIEKYS